MKINNITQKAIQEIEILYQQLNQSVPNQLIQSQIIFQHLLNIKKSKQFPFWFHNILQQDIYEDNIHGGISTKYEIKQLTHSNAPSFNQLNGIYYLDRYKAGIYLLNFSILNTLLGTILSHIKDYINKWDMSIEG